MLSGALMFLATQLFPASHGDELLPLEPLFQEEKPAQGASPAPAGAGFFDLANGELDLLAGIVSYSGDFEADPEFSVALLGRAPLPWLSRKLFGNGNLGGFVEAGYTRVDRDLDPRLEDLDGNPLLIAAGVDYEVMSGSFILRPQLGVQYVYFGGVEELDSGTALLLGAQAEYKLTEKLSIVAVPQLNVAGGDYMFFGYIGVGWRF